MSNFKGGSAGLAEAEKNTDSNFIRIFKDSKIYPVTLRQNVAIKGYIMPDFDRSLSNQDTEYATSSSPYRIKGMLDPTTNHDAFSSWFMPVRAYLYFGNKYNFLSPTQFKEPDPINDLRWHIKDNKLQQYDYLVEKPAYGSGDVWALPRYDDIKFMNAFCTPSYTGKDGKDTEMKPRILAMKYTGFEDLVKDLNDGGPRTVNPIDPDWNSYMYGDVTNPDRAVQFHSVIRQLNSKNAKGKYLALEFGTLTQNGSDASLRVETRAFSDDELSARVDLEDEETWYHPTYQEIVDLIIDMDLVPYDLLATVCGDKAEVHKKNDTPSYQSESTKRDSAETPSTDTQDHQPETPAAPAAPEPPAPPAPAAPAAPEPPAAPAPKPERSFWIAEGSNVTKVDETTLQSKVDAGFTGAVMLVGESAWKSAGDYGISKTVVPPAPAAPAAPEPPAPPAAPAAPAAPANPLTPPTSAALEMRTAEEEAEFNELTARVKLANTDPSKALASKELIRLGKLGRKRPYQG